MEFSVKETAAQMPGTMAAPAPPEKLTFRVGRPVVSAKPAAEAPAATPDPKAPAPSASKSGGNEGDKAASAPATAATAAPAAGEAKTEEKPPEEKADGKAFAALKRERQRTEAIVREAAPLIEAKAAWDKGDVDTVLAKLGIAGDKLVDLWVAKQGGTPVEGEPGATGETPAAVKALEAKIAALEEKLTKATATTEQQQAAAAIQQHVGRIGETLKADADRWEMAAKDPLAPQTAFDVMFHHHQRTGEYLTYEQALDAVEDFKINEALAAALPDRKARRALLGAKTQSGEQPAASPAATGANEDPMRQALGLKPRVTVTNSAASAAPTTVTTRTRGQEADERFWAKVRASRGGQ